MPTKLDAYKSIVETRLAAALAFLIASAVILGTSTIAAEIGGLMAARQEGATVMHSSSAAKMIPSSISGVQGG